MKRRIYSSGGQGHFLIIALLLTFFMRLVVFDGPPKVESTPAMQRAIALQEDSTQPVIIEDRIAYAVIKPADTVDKPVDSLKSDLNFDSLPAPQTNSNELLEQASLAAPPKATNSKVDAGPLLNKKPFPKIAIIIDDVGMSYKWSDGALALPAPMTLAFLPYAENLDSLTAQALDRGHETMIHVPMEPINSDLDLGPIALREDMSEEAFLDVLNDKVFPAFEGYKGINNHMGSKLTQNGYAMDLIMNALKKRDLYFIDSKTIHTSIAADKAAEHGVPFGERDVFLDHKDDYVSVMKSLKHLESVARKNGSAIAIGHPKKNTIRALQKWIPTMRDKGLELVPASALVIHGGGNAHMAHTVNVGSLPLDANFKQTSNSSN